MTIQVLETYNICTMEMNVQRSQYIHMQTWSTTAPNKQKVNFHTQFGICFMLSFLCVVPFVSFLSNSWK